MDYKTAKKSLFSVGLEQSSTAWKNSSGHLVGKRVCEVQAGRANSHHEPSLSPSGQGMERGWAFFWSFYK